MFPNFALNWDRHPLMVSVLISMAPIDLSAEFCDADRGFVVAPPIEMLMRSHYPFSMVQSLDFFFDAALFFCGHEKKNKNYRQSHVQ